jgi:hypothetical protein
MQYRITLEAGIPKRQVMTGKTLVLLDTGAALELDLSIETMGGYAGEELRGVKRGLKFQADGITGAKFLSLVDCVIEVVVSAANISVNYQENSTVNANIQGTVPVSVAQTLPVSVALPLAVVPDRGAPANPVYVSGLTYSDAPASAVTNAAPVAAGPVAVVVMAADAARKAARFLNVGPDPVALGAAGLTWAQRTIVLNAGDMWIEERGANVAWTAITDAAKSASVTVQGVMA